MATAWCKVSATLDSHPAIRRAGNLGRQVFEFALRRNAELDRNGVIPAAHLDPEYLAETLMLDSADQAAEGVSRCVRTGLLARDTRDSRDYVICGWDDEWGKRPLTEAERKRNQRAKARKETTSREVTEVSGHDRDSPDSHGSEERREEEIRSEEALPRARAIAPRAEQAPPSSAPAHRTEWHRHNAWWTAMLEADARLRAAGIEPNAPALPRALAPGSPHERAIATVERNLAAGGLPPEEVDAKMRHIVAVAEAEALREDVRHRRWFKPSLIWDPERAARAADTSLTEASTPRNAGRERAGPRGSAERAPVTGRVQPAAPEEYQTGDIPP